jgi:hypothetical protein
MPAPGATCPSGTCSVSLSAGGRGWSPTAKEGQGRRGATPARALIGDRPVLLAFQTVIEVRFRIVQPDDQKRCQQIGHGLGHKLHDGDRNAWRRRRWGSGGARSQPADCG